jgi:hypothetical protein
VDKALGRDAGFCEGLHDLGIIVCVLLFLWVNRRKFPQQEEEPLQDVDSV